ncbi:MAG: response regulator transcription factor [Candidatus Solibacter usitatus]|nr:response regulator transcription factor [Candidatus Solibacter usitatus]
MSEQIPVAICETQPLTAMGLEQILQQGGFPFAGRVDDLNQVDALLGSSGARILILDKSFGLRVVLEWVARHRIEGHASVIVWGLSLTEAEALGFLQVGAKGILRKTASAETVLSCLRAVAAGGSWMEDSLFREVARSERSYRAELTPRETQVMELVEQGLKNREIAHHLDIRQGTVKIHLKHIFEKTGVRGRYGLALSGMKEKGILAAP